MSSLTMKCRLITVIAWIEAWAGLATSVFTICLTYVIPSLKPNMPYYHIRAEPGVEHHDRGRTYHDNIDKRKWEDDEQETCEGDDFQESEPSVRHRDSFSDTSDTISLDSASSINSVPKTKSMTARVHKKIKKASSKALSCANSPTFILSRMPSFDLSAFPLSRTNSIESVPLIRIPSKSSLRSCRLPILITRSQTPGTPDSITPTPSPLAPNQTLPEAIQSPPSPSRNPLSPTQIPSSCSPHTQPPCSIRSTFSSDLKNQKKFMSRDVQSLSSIASSFSRVKPSKDNLYNTLKLKTPSLVGHTCRMKRSTSSNATIRG